MRTDVCADLIVTNNGKLNVFRCGKLVSPAVATQDQGRATSLLTKPRNLLPFQRPGARASYKWPQKAFDPRKSHLAFRRQCRAPKCALSKRGKSRQITCVNAPQTTVANSRVQLRRVIQSIDSSTLGINEQRVRSSSYKFDHQRPETNHAAHSICDKIDARGNLLACAESVTDKLIESAAAFVTFIHVRVQLRVKLAAGQLTLLLAA